jgi:hypothetical protein
VVEVGAFCLFVHKIVIRKYFYIVLNFQIPNVEDSAVETDINSLKTKRICFI